jgi:Glycosyltransferase family 87
MKASASWWQLYGFPVVMVAACIVTIVAVARRPDVGTTDFRTFYQSGRQFLAGIDPYVPFDPDRGPNLNPPWVVASMAQLCRVPLAVAVAVWWLFSFACLFAAIVLIARAVAPGGPYTVNKDQIAERGARLARRDDREYREYLREEQRGQPGCPAREVVFDQRVRVTRQVVAIASLVLATQAAYANLRLGQVAWPLMLLVTGAWLADRSRRQVLCGVLLGAAASWKPFLLIFVPYLIWRRQWRSLGALAAVVAATVVVGVLAVGTSGYASWFGMLGLVGWEGHLLNASVRGLITRALTSSTMLEEPTTPILIAPGWVSPVWLAVSAALAAVLAARMWSKPAVDTAWAGLLLVAVLISPLGWLHYVPLGIGPLVAALMAGGSRVPRAAVAGWLLLCVPFEWLKGLTFGPALTITLASSYAWGTILLLIAVVRARAPGPGEPSRPGYSPGR